MKNFFLNMAIQGFLGGSGGGASSWNDLADKPFGEEVTEGVLVYDGDISKHETANWQGYPVPKMSDKALTKDDLVGSICVICNVDSNGNCTKDQHIIEAEDIMDVPLDEAGAIAAYMVIVGIQGMAISVIMDLSEMGLPLGTYFFDVPGSNGAHSYCESISCLTGEVETIKTIDEKYLPGPKLLGELVLTSENCTAVGDNSLNFNEELQATMSNLFEVIDKELRPLYIVLSVANVKHRCVGSYVANPDGRWVTTIASSSISGQPTDTWVGEDEFTSSDHTVISAVIGGYPVTIKVYAV